MPTATGQDVVDQARILLQDVTSGGVRWPDAEMLYWVNAGQEEIARLKPAASAQTTVVAMVEGTRQSLPAGGFALIDVVRNMGTGGSTPGRAIRRIEKDIMDQQNPSWHTVTGVAEMRHFMYDPQNPLEFLCYPPQPSSGQGQVEMIWADTPTALGTLSATLTLEDIYTNALVNYVMFRALSKDSTYTKEGVDPQSYYTQMVSAIGATI